MRRVHEMAEDDPELLAFLEASAIMPGKRMTVADLLPFNEILAVTDEDGQVVTLSFKTARFIFVERVNAAGG